MAGAAHPLQERRDTARRADLAYQIDIANVDAQFQRSGGDQHPQFAALQALLGVEPVLLGQAAMMGGHLFGADALGQMARHPLRHAPRVDKYQRGTVQGGQFREAVVDALPHFVGHHRLKRHRRQFQSKVARAHMADIHHCAFPPSAAEKVRDDR